MKISVVVPTYKRPELLIKCLIKLSEQDFSKRFYEVIIITDGPDIETMSIVNLLSQQQIFFNLFCCSLDKKRGPAAARNKGVDLANGKLIVFTDDDCLPKQDWLTEYWNFYDSLLYKTEVGLRGRTIVPHSKMPTDYENNIAQLEKAEFITANCAITKTAFKKIDGFDENFLIAWREDSDMHFKLIKNNIEIHSVNNAIVVHPVRKAKWGISLKEQKKSLYNALLYKKHSFLYKKRISAKPVWNYYVMILVFFMFILALINKSNIFTLSFFATWAIFFTAFILKRLKSNSKKLSHVAEIIATSALIPFLSVFWTLYGSFKYKTFFL